MRALVSRIATLLIVAGTGVGCGGSGSGTGPGGSVLTTFEVTPATAALFTVAPGNVVALSVVAKDQDDRPIGSGATGFSSDNDAIATVSNTGTITALTAGTAHITASLTAGSVTKTATTAVTSLVAPANAGVSAPALAFSPANVDVRAGGAVSWSIGSITHDITFSTPNSPVNIPALQDGLATRTFTTNGTFRYRCSIHAQMTGVVYVH